MVYANKFDDILIDWLKSNKQARIAGLSLVPIAHPLMSDSVQCITKGQATVYFLKQHPYGHTWLLKKFASAKRPDDDYLFKTAKYLPGTNEFYTCTQRRFLKSNHFDIRNSDFKNKRLSKMLDGSILMPKVPGNTWTSVSDELRQNNCQLTLDKRLTIALNLANCISILESSRCSHRDLSGGNVFVNHNCRIYLIDWDCLYHPNLKFQTNTTVGTRGYIAPFIYGDQNANAKLSWCDKADRFALAVLIAEFILTNSFTPPASEDGSLFSQNQITEANNDFIKEQIYWLRVNSKPCAKLFQKALDAKTFSQCPSPQDWISAIKFSLKNIASAKTKNIKPKYIKFICDNCGSASHIRANKHDKIKSSGHDLLCKNCFEKRLDLWQQEDAKFNHNLPEVSCEHCHKKFRIKRTKLNSLLGTSKPLLCRSCLKVQIIKWREESASYCRKYPSFCCSSCNEIRRMKAKKLNELYRQGKKPLCKKCLDAQLNSFRRTPSWYL